MANQWHPVLIRALAQCLHDTFSGGYYADKVLERAFKNNRQWGGRDRKFLAETLYDMVRWWSLLAAFDGEVFVPASPDDYIRRWIFYEAWRRGENAFDFAQKSFPASVVDLNFDSIRKKISETKLEPWTQVAFPQWLAEKFQEDYGEESMAILKALNEPAPVCLRANRLKTTRDILKMRLAEEEVLARPSSTAADGLVLEVRKNVFATKAFREGLFEMQDEASQKVAPLLSPKPGERIVDICAGAGGKTMHLAALMQNKGTLLACDVSERKLEQLKIRARRGGVSNLRIQLLENSKSVKRHAEKFDGVLIDAPCSGTGVIRRNCDTKWKLNAEELKRLLDLQSQILDDYSKLVKPKGRLVYATCSLLRAENQNQIDAFLQRRPDFRKDGPPLTTRPDLDGEDGFYAQKLVRS